MKKTHPSMPEPVLKISHPAPGKINTTKICKICIRFRFSRESIISYFLPLVVAKRKLSEICFVFKQDQFQPESRLYLGYIVYILL